MDSIAHPKIQLILELKNQMKAGFKSAKQMVVRDVEDMKSQLKSFKASVADTFRNKVSGMTGGVPILGDMFSGFRGKAALIAGGIGLVTTAGVKATAMSAGWDKSMAKVNVTAQLQRKELRALSADLRDIAGRNATAFEDTPEAFNKIISSGLSTKKSLDLLEPTLKAAKAGFTDIETVAKAATSVMASSGVEDSTRLYDILFATLNKGNAEFGDIANYLPKIIPLARTAGLELEETAGAFAYLTAQGLRAEAAATGLQNVFKSFSDGRTIKGFKKIGVDIFDAKGQMRGMMPILGDLKKQMAGLTDKQRTLKFDSVGLDMEAAATLASMLQDYDKLGTIVKFVTNSQGEFNRAIENSETATDSWEKSMNRLKKSMMDLGDVLLPIVDIFAQGVGGIMDFVQWGGGKLEDAWRWIKGDPSRREEWGLKQQEQRHREYMTSVGARMNDDRINAFVQRDYAKMWMEEFNRGKVLNTEGVNDIALASIKQLEDQKKIIESAIDSGDKKIKRVLKENGIGDMNDFYRLMESGGLTPVAGKLKGMLKPMAGKTPADATAAGVAKTVSGAQQQKNVTINIDSYIKGDLITQNKAIQNMSAGQLQQFLMEGFVRLVRGAETGMI